MSTAVASPSLNILVVRPDRLGDVVLSTPVLEVLKRHYPKSRLTFMVREAVAPVVRGLPAIDDLMIFDPEGQHAGTAGFFRLLSEIRQHNFRIAVVLQSHWKIAAALFAAGVRYRVGPLNKPHSFLYFNRGVRQRRSQVEMHEADYNLQLLRRLGIRVPSRTVPTRVVASAEAREQARQWLRERGWQEGGSPLVAIHPGMGGSALNWPETHYLELTRAMLKDGYQVLLTGGPQEGELLQRLAAELGPGRSRVMLYGGADVGLLDRLVGLYSWIDLAVAPSTGPLHVAAALGKPVVTFYPPIRVQSALRWGPYLPDDRRASILTPEVYCGEEFRCRGNLCNYYPCMRSLSVSQAVEQIRSQLSRAHETGAAGGKS